MAGVDIGTAYLTVAPSAKGFAGKLQSELGGGMKQAGSKAALGFGSSLSSGLLSTAKKLAAPLAALFAVKAVKDFASASIGAFKTTSAAATGLQRAIGGSVEDASRLNFAAKESGVATDSFARSMKLLAKNIGNAGGKAAPGAKALAAIGIAGKDAAGKTRPIADLLPQIAEKFKALPNGADKSALAMKLFGKAGLDMLPLLNKGKDGITDLMKESDRFGLTIGTKQAAEVKKAAMAQREWHAALQGVKVQIGVGLLPLLTSFAGFFRDRLIPVIITVSGNIRDFFQQMQSGQGAGGRLAGVLKVIASGAAALAGWFSGSLWPALKAGYQTILPGLQQGLSIVAGAFKGPEGASGSFKETLRKVGEVITTKVIPFIAQLFRVYLPAAAAQLRAVIEVVKALYSAFQTWKTIVSNVISFVLKKFADLSSMWAAVLRALGKVPGFGWAADAAKKLQNAADKANNVARAIDNIDRNVTIRVGFQQTGRIKLPDGSKVNIGQRATGGPVKAGHPYVVGEKRPELFVPDRNGTIIPSVPSSAGAGGGKQLTIQGNVGYDPAGIFVEWDKAERLDAALHPVFGG